MGGINGIKEAARAAGYTDDVTMRYDNETGEQVFMFNTGDEIVEARALDGATPDQIVAQAMQMEAPAPLPLMSLAQLEPVVFKEAAPQIENYDLVEDGSPMPKPALFFYDVPKKETP